MSLRIYNVGAILMLAACGGADGADSREAGVERIVCAFAGDDGFSQSCTIEQSQGAQGTMLTIRHPDGGFRRLAVTADGRGVMAADGAEAAIVTPLAQGLIEVRLGDARYRLPATVKAAQ